MKCLKCEKPMSMMKDMEKNPDDGGEMVVSFHYGSRHDMCLGMPERLARHDKAKTYRERLLFCDQIRAYICDDCFEKHIDLFQGWQVIRQAPIEKQLV